MIGIRLVVSVVVADNGTLQTHNHIRVVSMVFTAMYIFEQSACCNRLTLQTCRASKLNLIELKVRKARAGYSRRDSAEGHINNLSIQTDGLK